MQKTKKVLTPPKQIIHDTMRRPDFANGLLVRDRDSVKRRVSTLALRAAGLENELPTIPSSVHNDEKPFLTLEQFSLRLFTRIEPYATSQKALDHMDRLKEQGINTPRSAKIPHLLNVIRFDHTVSDIMDAYPDVSEANILQFAMQTMLANGHSVKEIEVTKRRMQDVLTGMKHENAFEDACWSMEEVESVERPTEEDELDGIDRIVTFQNGFSVAVDVKLPKAAAKAKETRHDDNIVISPFTDDDFVNGRLTPEAKKRKLPKVRAALAHHGAPTREPVSA